MSSSGDAITRSAPTTYLDDRILRERASLREAAGNTAVQECGLDALADGVSAIEERDVAPEMHVRNHIPADVIHDPRALGIVVVEFADFDGIPRVTTWRRWLVIVEQRRVLGDKNSRRVEYFAWAPVIFLRCTVFFAEMPKSFMKALKIPRSAPVQEKIDCS